MLANGNAVTVVVNTKYPFSDSLSTTITAAKAFTFSVRIPAWATAGTISVNGKKATAVAPVNGLHSVKIAAGTTNIVLNLPSAITTGQPARQTADEFVELIFVQRHVLKEPSRCIAGRYTTRST